MGLLRVIFAVRVGDVPALQGLELSLELKQSGVRGVVQLPHDTLGNLALLSREETQGRAVLLAGDLFTVELVHSFAVFRMSGEERSSRDVGHGKLLGDW